MSKIKILDENTISKIAAGEVIERPSSIVKELIENSIDAKSDNIIIDIEDGGKSLIRVTDNGEGMNEDDIRLAFKRHSTSKLRTIEDIYTVLSLGFRGEALASISSIAKVEVLSKTDSSDVGLHGVVKDSDLVKISKVGCPKGTTIIIRDIFYNIPVRQKFLKKPNIESNHVNDVINKLALGNPKISFKFIKDGKIILKTAHDGNLENTVYSVLGKDYHKNLIPINYEDEELKIHGFISNNKLYRSNRNHQYLYINGRYVYDLKLSKIIENQYSSIIPLNRLPAFILNLKIDPHYVDVNIHPTKQEIKFSHEIEIYTKISRAIRDALIATITIPGLKTFEGKEENKLPELFNKQINNDEMTRSKQDSNIVIKDFTFDNYSEDKYNKNDKNKHFTEKYSIDSSKEESISQEFTEQKIKDIILDIKPIGRVFNTYIIAESKDEEKLYFIDQHAAHERIMFEKYMEEFRNEDIIIQELLFPVVINLTNSELYIVEENKDVFRDLGFLIEPFGNNSIALRGVPMLFGQPNVEQLFLDVLDGLSEELKSSYDTKIDKIMKISCTKAIKSGDKITDLEIMALFKSLRKCKNPYTCPHGRPTIIHLSKRDIEKEFLRII